MADASAAMAVAQAAHDPPQMLSTGRRNSDGGRRKRSGLGDTLSQQVAGETGCRPASASMSLGQAQPAFRPLRFPFPLQT
jgi:hypothetical protein